MSEKKDLSNEKIIILIRQFYCKLVNRVGVKEAKNIMLTIMEGK